MPYTANRKISGLDPASTVADGHELPISQAGTTNRASLTQIQANVFGSKTAKTTVDGTEVVVVRQTDNSLRQVALDNIVKPLLITNAMVSGSAAIVDTKLATISTAGKVSNSATTATNANTASAIVARDASGNFNAGTITATLSGNSSTATTLQTGRTISITGDLAYTSPSFNGSADVTAAATISNNAVTTAKILDANVTTAKLANDAVTFAKMQNSSASGLSVIGRSANSSGDFDELSAGTDGHALRRSGTTLGFGQIATAGITDAAVTTAKIADANVTTAKIADANVTTAKIADANVTTAKIADANVTTAKIADANVTAAKLASNAVETTKIADANVTAAKLASNAVETAKIANSAITQAKVATGVAGTGPAFRAHKNTTQTLSNNTATKITFPVEDFDTANCFVPGSGATESRFTPNVAGYYLVSGRIYGARGDGNGLGYLVAAIWKNGARHSLGSYVQGLSYGSTVTDLVYFNGTTDYVELYGFHADGGPRNIGYTDSENTYFSASLVRAA